METLILSDWHFSIHTILPYHKRPSQLTFYCDHPDAHPIEDFHQDPKTKKPITQMKQQNTCTLIVTFLEEYSKPSTYISNRKDIHDEKTNQPKYLSFHLLQIPNP
jgi:hypothetical protein